MLLKNPILFFPLKFLYDMHVLRHHMQCQRPDFD